MNKILLNSEDEISNLVIDEDTELIINYANSEKKINIIVEDNVCLNVLETGINTKNDICFTLKDNSFLQFDRLIKNSIDMITVYLDGYKSSCKIDNSLVSVSDSYTKYSIIHNNNSNSVISNHGINVFDNKLEFNIDAHITSNGSGSICKQENKIINLGEGKSTILPNLIVDVDDVDASHSAYIGDFDKEIIFYMNSRGIPTDEIKKVLLRNFILRNKEYKNQEFIDTILDY